MLGGEDEYKIQEKLDAAEALMSLSKAQPRQQAQSGWTSETSVSFMGEELPIPALNWDGTPNEQVKQCFDLLSACDCCERHQTHRPTSVHGWHDTPDRKQLRDEVCNDSSRCQCECRLRMRFIARNF